MQIVIRAQSAMEYLMTYGWAILIIAVVLGALFELGVFSGTFFMPHVPPGSCHVFRPYGPGTLGSINLEGECQGALPEYTYSYFNNAPRFATEGYINISYTSTSPLFVYDFTVAMWLKEYSLAESSTCCSEEFNLFSEPLRIHIYRDWKPLGTARVTAYIYNQSALGDPGLPSIPVNYCSNNNGNVSLNTWNFFAFTYNGTYLVGYVNGKEFCKDKIEGTISPYLQNSHGSLVSSANASIGSLNGTMSNVQLYNGSLSANDILSLYQEGIGGAPINLQNLVGWWPLNGNANDYSGNKNDGTAVNVIYTSNWESGYTQP